MIDAYQKGISPNEWRKSLKADTDFLRSMEDATREKSIRLKNQTDLLKSLGA